MTDPSHAATPMPDLADLGALNTAVLRQGAKRLGVPLDVATVAAFERYAAEMVAWNTRVNLTRILRPDEIAVRHFLDSLVCLRGLAPEEADHPLRCIDVGAGAGLPGIPLKLVRPAWSLALVESVGKKVAFLEHLVGILRLPDVLVLHARAEDVGRDPAHRERFHLAVARAVARLPVLAELLLPLVRPGGRVITLKGEDIADEVRRSEPVLRLLGGELFEVQPYHLPGLRAPRHLVVVAKTGTTPPAYPRRAGVPERQPLA